MKTLTQNLKQLTRYFVGFIMIPAIPAGVIYLAISFIHAQSAFFLAGAAWGCLLNQVWGAYCWGAFDDYDD